MDPVNFPTNICDRCDLGVIQDARHIFTECPAFATLRQEVFENFEPDDPGVNKLAFKWIIIWEKFPQNGLWGRVSSRRRRVAKLFPRENYHPLKADGKISSQGRVSLP